MVQNFVTCEPTQIVRGGVEKEEQGHAFGGVQGDHTYTEKDMATSAGNNNPSLLSAAHLLLQRKKKIVVS